MFKKAEKSELKTWFLGSAFLFILSAIAVVLFVGNMIENEVTVASVIFAVIFAAVAFLCCFCLINILKAYVSFDKRKEEREKQEAIDKAKAEEELAEKIQKEKEEMEEIRKREEEKARQNAIELEAKRKEALENEANSDSNN